MQLKQVVLSISMSTILALGLNACNGGGDSAPPTAADLFVQSLNSQDPYYVYQVTKETTQRGGSWVVVSQGQNQTPYWSSSGKVCKTNDPDPSCDTQWVDYADFAINMADPTINGYGNQLGFFNATGLSLNYDYGSGLYIDTYGNKYEKQGAVIKDLNVLGAQADQIRRGVYAHDLQARYGLSSERSMSLAKMGVNLQSLAKQNGGQVPAKDAAAFEQFAFGGLQLKTVMEHVQAGDKAAFDKDKKTIADANGIAVEDVNFLLQNSKL